MQTPHGPPFANGHSGNGASSPDVRLREQAVEAFGVLQRRADYEVTPERLRAFLQAKHVTHETLFDLLADFGRAKGLIVTTRVYDADELLAADAEDHLLLLPSGDIGMVVRTRAKAGTVTVLDFGTDERATYEAEELAQTQGGTLQLLCLQGQVHRFLDGGEHAPPLRGHQPSEAHDPHDHHGYHDNTAETFASLLRLLSDERRDIVTITMYAVMVSIFALSIPLASQGIIDAVSLGVLTNQLFVLCGAIATGLLLYGVFTMLQYYTVDVLQRRLFAATGLEIAYRLPMMRRSALQGEYGPELVNRFFDVITMQKGLAKILIDGLSYSLVALSSLVLLGIYSPFFLIVGLLAVLFTPVLIWGLGRNGLKTSIKESSMKYAMAHWLEDLARCHQSFKLHAAPAYVHGRTDRLAAGYVRARGAHFRVFGRQLAGAMIFRALIVGLALGIGGFLVTQGDITLGQFVAAELVIVSLTSAGFNLVKLFDDGYDLLTAISKILHVTDKPLESVGGETPPQGEGPVGLSVRHVTVGYDGNHGASNHAALDDVSFEVRPGARLCIVGESGAGKTTLARTLVGLHRLSRGRITYDGHDIMRLDLRLYRQHVRMALPIDELFEGTIEDNITMGRPFAYQQVEEALRIAHLDEDVLALPKGLHTPVTSAGLEFPQGFVRRLMLARTVIGRPRVLILDEAFNGIEEPVKSRLVETIYSHEAWTIITIDDDPDTIRRADHVLVLDDGHIIKEGSPEALSYDPGDFLEEHFPQLVASLRDRRPSS
jgi:ATP-binding cassette subfamily B protein